MSRPTVPRGVVVCLLGAESTGKTTLASALGQALGGQGCKAAVVDEYLRAFCEQHGRTPRADEQRSIADEQMRRIDAAAASHDVVVADTSALMIAVYSEQVFGDTDLYDYAQNAQRRCDLTLLTALDLPWQADGLQRDGPQVREPVDAKLRAALNRAGIAHGIVWGSGRARLAAALAAVHHALARRAHADDGDGSIGAPLRWHGPHCERCGDADGERRTRLFKPS